MTTNKQTEDVKELIKIGLEGERVDFKEEIYHKKDKKSLLKDILSIANSHANGDKYIIFGIKDNPKNEEDIVGIPDGQSNDSNIYDQLINSNIEPHLEIEKFNMSMNNKNIEIIHIKHINFVNRPFLLKKDSFDFKKGTCFIRKGTSNDFSTREDYDKFYKERTEFEISVNAKISSYETHNERILVVPFTFYNDSIEPIVLEDCTLIIKDDVDNMYKTEIFSKNQNDINLKPLIKGKTPQEIPLYFFFKKEDFTPNTYLNLDVTFKTGEKIINFRKRVEIEKTPLRIIKAMSTGRKTDIKRGRGSW